MQHPSNGAIHFVSVLTESLGLRANLLSIQVALGILARIGVTQVTCATNGREALEAVDQHGGGSAFDIVLTDLHMPLLGGMEVVSELRRKYPTSPMVLVAVTADAFEDTRDRCLGAGFDAWLAKPFRVEDLARVIADSRRRLKMQ